MIVATVGSGNANVTYVGDEFLRETTVAEDGVDGYLYGGKLTLKVNINIFAGTMRDAEHLSDIVILYTRYLFRNKFAEFNMAYTTISNQGIKQDGNMFTNEVGTEVTCEFSHFIEKSLYDMVQGMTFEIGTYFEG
jgi:hypothetical protein